MVRLFSVTRIIGRDCNNRISNAFPSFILFDINLYHERTRILIRLTPRALFPSGSSGTRTLLRHRLRNTIKLFLATIRSQAPCVTEVKGFRRFRVVIYFRPCARVSSSVWRKSWQRKTISSSLVNVSSSVLDFLPLSPQSSYSFCLSSFLSLLCSLPHGFLRSFLRDICVVCFTTLSPQIRMRNQSLVGFIKILTWNCNFSCSKDYGVIFILQLI